MISINAETQDAMMDLLSQVNKIRLRDGEPFYASESWWANEVLTREVDAWKKRLQREDQTQTQLLQQFPTAEAREELLEALKDRDLQEVIRAIKDVRPSPKP